MAEDLNLELNKDDFEDIELSDIEKLLKLLNSDAKTKESDLKEFDYDILDDNDWFESDTEEKIKWTIESMKDMKEKISFIEGIIKHVKVFEIKRKEERQKMLEQSIDELSWISMSDYRHTEPEPIQSKNDISSNFSLNWQNNQSPINLSVSWQNNQSSIFDSFSLTSSQSRLRPVVEWNDLGIGSFAINTYNETLNKEEIINHLEYWMDNIADENVIISMQKELIAINKWKQPDNLTYLLISYSVNKEREMTKWMSLARWAHNDTQKYYINNIIWNTKWYSEKYIQWYNTDLWNYLKETKDFEEEAKHKKPESINSLELTHYLLMLEDNNTLTTEKLLSVFWRAFLLWLWELWEERKEKWAPSKLQELIQNKWLESLFNISVISNHQLSDIMPLIKDHEKRINWKTNEYFISNPEHIRLINDKERLTSVLEHYKSNNEFFCPNQESKNPLGRSQSGFRHKRDHDQCPSIGANDPLMDHWMEENFRAREFPVPALQYRCALSWKGAQQDWVRGVTGHQPDCLDIDDRIRSHAGDLQAVFPAVFPPFWSLFYPCRPV